MHLFYFPDLSGDLIALDEDESKHAVRVLRLQKGDIVELVDGKGTRAEATVEDDHAKRCTLLIQRRQTETTGRNFRLHIAVAPTKNADRLEWFVEKATEIGIDRITLIQCDHSEKEKVKIERLEKLVVSAMKQSQQSWLPEIHGVLPLRELLENNEATQKFIAHCEDGEKRSLQAQVKQVDEVLILIGPEGDFSGEEISLAMKNGFHPVSLGDTRLRTETAALYAVVSAHLAAH